jgi:prepilin-type N-terminal cleavage/methylation domain-containing protein
MKSKKASAGFRRRMIDPQHGFSLIEAFIAIAVASILAGMAIPMFSTAMDQSNADSAAQLIAQELNLARAMAVGIHGDILVQFDSAKNSVVVAAGTGSVRGPFLFPGKMTLLNSNPVLDTPDALGNTVLGPSGNNEVAFMDNGAAATDASGATLCSGTFFIRHVDGDPATLRAVTLLGGTGRVHIWRYNPNSDSWK